MKKTLLLGAVAASLLAVNAVQAAPYAPYVSAKTGLSHVTNDPSHFSKQDENVWFGSVALGADLREGDNPQDLMFELEYTYRPEFSKHSLSAGNMKFQSKSLMLNGYYVIPARMEVKPYLSAGIGFSSNERKVTYTDGSRFKKDADMLTWSLGVGVLLPEVVDYTDVMLGYRFVDMGSFKSGYSDVDMYANEFFAGISYKF